MEFAVHGSVTQVKGLALLLGSSYIFDSVQLNDLFFDQLVNQARHDVVPVQKHVFHDSFQQLRVFDSKATANFVLDFLSSHFQMLEFRQHAIYFIVCEVTRCLRQILLCDCFASVLLVLLER